MKVGISITALTNKCAHRPEPKLPYLTAYDDAQERMKRGERQQMCPCCMLYIWQSYFSPCDWPTKAMAGGQCVTMPGSSEERR